MYFDEAVEIVGGAGAYQVSFLGMVFAVSLLSFDVGGVNFIGGNMKHWCRIPALENFTHAEQKEIGIPDESMDQTFLHSFADLDYESCYRLPFDFDNISLDDLKKWNRTEKTAGISRNDWVKCDRGWVYDQSDWISTINSEWDLVCDDSWKVSLIGTLLMAGWLVGALCVGPISDRFGRKWTAIGVYTFRMVGSYICIYSPNFEVYCFGRFFVGLFMANIGLVQYVILQEITSIKWRAAFGIAVYGIGAIGQMILGTIASYVRDHFYLQAIYMWPLIFLLPFYVMFIDESPRWLISKGREEEAIKILKKVITLNKGKGAQLPENTHFKEEFEKQAKIVKGSYLDLFRTPNIRRRMFIIGFCWFTTSLVTYGLNLNVGRLPGDVFVNFILISAVDIPCRATSIYILGRFGRRKSISGFILTAGVLMLLCIIFLLTNDVEIVATVLAILGKGIIGMGFTGMYSFTSELSPTPIRNIALSFGSVCARVSGMAAPFVGGPLGDLWVALPNMVFGVFGLLAGFIVLLLPETVGHKLPETIADAEQFGKGKRKDSSELPPIEDVYTVDSVPEGNKITQETADDLYASQETITTYI